MKRAFEVFNFSVSRQKRGPHGCRHPECNETETDYLFIIFPDTENALVAIVPALANKGLIEVEMENARREILCLMEGPDPGKLPLWERLMTCDSGFEKEDHFF